MRRILVPMDHTTRCAELLLGVTQLFAPGSVELHLYGVAQRPENYLTVDAYVSGLAFSTYRISCTDEQWRKHCHGFATELQQRVEGLQLAGYQAQSYLRSGKLSEVILRAAAAERYDLLVLAQRPTSGLARWLTDNRVEQLAQQVNLPVLLIATDFVYNPAPALPGKLEALRYEPSLAHSF